jgi:protein phosphatase-4 regulatory subunit 3
MTAALRYIRSCLKLSNHFVIRYFIKNELYVPLLDVLEAESTKDNMLSSACMELLDIIRKVSLMMRRVQTKLISRTTSNR